MRMKRQYDRYHRQISFRVGDKVYLKLGHGYDIPLNQVLPRRLRQRYVGRFEVLERVGNLAYRLDIPTESRIHPVISVAHLEPAPAGDDPWGRQPLTGEHQPTSGERFPDDIVYEVDRILAKRVVNAPGRPRRDGTRRQITKYLVRWKNQSARYDCWVKEEDCIGCEEAIREFEERQDT